MEIIEYVIERYDDVISLMRNTPGVSVRSADSKESMERYLNRNPGLSFLAVDGNEVIGCAMCGHDGRRGYLQHVIVAPSYRGQGIAQVLVERCLSALKRIGITKVHLDVFVTNELANRYWAKRGWTKREDINRYSLTLDDDENA
ncbi:MAG: GNAT family N-acetyltransferase [Gammaproteobacteria bacterium]